MRDQATLAAVWLYLLAGGIASPREVPIHAPGPGPAEAGGQSAVPLGPAEPRHCAPEWMGSTAGALPRGRDRSGIFRESVRGAEGSQDSRLEERDGQEAARSQNGVAAVRERILASVVGIRVTLPDPKIAFTGKRKVTAEVSPSHGTGSGIIVDPSGLILTCAHVVRDATSARIFLAGDREVPGKVVVADRTSDLALVKVEAGQLSALDMRDAPMLRQGQTVTLVSRSGGATVRLAEGTLAAPGSYHVGHSPLEFFRQFFGQIEPGDSGGPLVDETGRFIGIVSVGLPDGKVGYAIAREFALVALARLRGGAPVVWPWLGLGVETPPELPGALIWTVAPGSPGAAAGLAPGDRIVSLDGRTLDHFLPAMLTVIARPVGSRFSLGVVKGRGVVPPQAGEAEPKAAVVLSAARPLEPRLPPLDLFAKLTGIRLGITPASAAQRGGLSVIAIPPNHGEGRRGYALGSRLLGFVPGVGVVRTLEEGRTDQQMSIHSPEDLGEALRSSIIGDRVTAALIWSTQGREETMLLSGEARSFPYM